MTQPASPLLQADNSTLEIASGQIREKDNGTTNAKLAQAAAYTFKCNPTSGTANVQDATLATIGVADGQILENVGGVPTGIPLPFLAGGRLGLDSNYVSTSDLTAQLVLNWNPGGPSGDRLPIFDGTRWKIFSSSQLTIKATDSAQTGSSISGTTITGLTGTAQLVPGMTLTNSTGTGTLAANTVIATIASATSITVNNAASVNGTLTNLTFKLPASTVFDVILVNDGGTLRLLWGPKWTNTTTRASSLTTQNGINVNSGSWTTGWTNSSASVGTTTGTYLGTVYVGTTAGQLNDAGGNTTTQVGGQRFVWNAYNRVARWMTVFDSTASFNYSTASYQQYNAAAGNKVEYVSGLGEDSLIAHSIVSASSTANTNCAGGVGVDSTTTNSALAPGTNPTLSGNNIGMTDAYIGNPGIGYHALNWLQRGGGTGTQTWYGSGTNNAFKAGLSAQVLA